MKPVKASNVASIQINFTWLIQFQDEQLNNLKEMIEFSDSVLLVNMKNSDTDQKILQISFSIKNIWN